MCSQEICTGGWYKALQQSVYNTSTRRFNNVFTTLPQVFFCNAPPRRLYILQRVYATCTSVFCKLFTKFVQVFLKGFYNTCTCDFERCSQQLYRCFLKGFYNTCTCVFESCLQRLCGVFWKASTTFTRVLRTQLLHQLYKCPCKVSQRLRIGFERLYNMRTSASQGS